MCARTRATLPNPMRQEFAQLDDDALFAEVLRRRVAAKQGPPSAPSEDLGVPLGALCERWRKPAFFVIKKIQASHGRGSPDDEPELFQEAVRKLLDRGLDQYRGVSEQVPGKSASPKTFFLRIVKHV